MSKKVVAIVGSYRKGGMIDQAVEAILEGARDKGATTQTIYLNEKHIAYCTNCRECVQAPGPERGKCTQQDDLESILQQIEAADAILLASPVNFGNVTAIFRTFMERLSGYVYWPWGQNAPSPRSRILPRKAVLVASSAMPGFLIPLVTGTGNALLMTAKILGAKPIGRLWIGFAAGNPNPLFSKRNQQRARRLGFSLA